MISIPPANVRSTSGWTKRRPAEWRDLASMGVAGEHPRELAAASDRIAVIPKCGTMFDQEADVLFTLRCRPQCRGEIRAAADQVVETDDANASVTYLERHRLIHQQLALMTRVSATKSVHVHGAQYSQLPRTAIFPRELSMRARKSSSNPMFLPSSTASPVMIATSAALPFTAAAIRSA